MNFKINLAKKVIIFYSVITPFIVVGSAYNLIYGLILHETPTVGIGVFSLFGFIVLPLLLVSTYRQNICTITAAGICIGKEEFAFANYHFELKERQLARKDRPIFSGKSKLYDIVVRSVKTNGVVLDKNLDVFKGDIEKIKDAFPAGKLRY